jgi:hypothetical protein
MSPAPKPKRHIRTSVAIVSLMTVLGCGGGSIYSTTSTTSAGVKTHAAEALLVDTAACWLGGVWGDVEAETPVERERSSHARCDAVVAEVYGQGDRTHYLKLRAFDPETLDAVKSAIGHTAARDPADAKHADELVRIFSALAVAEQETTLARRAAHRILRDLDREPEKLSDEETRALPELEAFSGFAALYRMDAGDLRAERHALALFVLLERLRIAENLPAHLKPYVVVFPMKEVFSAPVPDLPYDASRPLGRGAWLRYLEEAAQQARHPIPDWSRPVQVRHEQAMAGILEGVADQLRADRDTIDGNAPLAHIIDLTIRALEQSRARAMQ